MYTMFVMALVVMTEACTKLSDEYGCEGTMTMMLVNCTPESSTTYQAEYDVIVTGLNLGTAVMQQCGIASEYGSNMQMLEGQLHEGQQRVTVKGLKYGQQYKLRTFIQTDEYTFYGTTADPLEVASVYNITGLEAGEATLLTYNSVTITVHLPESQAGQLKSVTIELSRKEDFSRIEKQQRFTSPATSTLKVTFTELMASSTYYHRVKITDQQGKEAVSRAKSISTEIANTDIQAVDLGLSVLWSDRNYGATSEHDRGDKYTWNIGGGINCQYLNISGTEDDWGTFYLGDGWRMPTNAEAVELNNTCTHSVDQWGSTNAEKGMRLTAPNGNSILVPWTDRTNGEDVFLFWTGEGKKNTDYYGSTHFYGYVLFAGKNFAPVTRDANGHYPVRLVKDRR